MLNQHTSQFFQRIGDDASRYRLVSHDIAGAAVMDAGIKTPGSLAAGLILARLCLADHAEVSISPCEVQVMGSDNAVSVQTDQPLVACLGSQYAGWPVQSGDFFAMGSGPMRLVRGKEEMLQELKLNEESERVVGVLESDRLPDPSVIEMVAKECHVASDCVSIAVAPSTSIAGSVQVVARSVETAMHKLHALGFDVRTIVSATGVAPLPPPARPGDTITGIGRTNDAVLYAGRVTMWVDCDDDQIDAVVQKVPSQSSPDHGRPFAEVFRQYDCDFYQVDPMLFSPAHVTFHNLRSGRTHRAGSCDLDVLNRSFGS